MVDRKESLKMEENQVTCPQCGLLNNYLAETCAQCGIIFVKNQPENASQTSRDEQKRKAIEEAEAILDQTLPPPELDAFGNDIVKKIDLPEDTVEMQIPVEKEAAMPKEPNLEENQDPETHEIELEAIEAPPESPTGAVEAEELFLSEIVTPQTAVPAAAEAAGTGADSPAASEKFADSSEATVKSHDIAQDHPDPKKVDGAVKQSETAPAAEIKLQTNSGEEKSDQAEFEDAELIKAQLPSEEVIQPADTRNNAAAKAGPAEPETPFEEKQQATAVRQEAVQSETQIRPEATIEMPQETAEAPARAKRQEHKAAEEAQKGQHQVQVLEALKRQRERQAKAEASDKEQAAQTQAGVSEKKKLAMAKAEALKKQQAAQAKAEALRKQKAAKAKALALKKQMVNQARLQVLKKQKAAQAKAEASAQEIEVASAGILPAGSKASMGNHEKLLGLLKRYKGKAIGINYDNSAEIKEAELVDANEEFFSVMVKDKKLQYSYPLKTILTIVEGQEGVETGDENQQTKFDAVIKVFPLVLFK
jgi:hypothetical protein